MEKQQGNTQRALDHPPDVFEKSQVQIQGLRDELKEETEGLQKAEVEAAELRVEVEALRRTTVWGWPRCSLTSTLSATFTA